MLGARTAAWAKSGGQYGGLCFTAESANSSVQLTAVGTPPAVTLVKSFDGINWEAYAVGEVIELPSIGKYVYLAAGEGGNETFGSSSFNYHKFVINGLMASSGDITSLRRFDLIQTPFATYCYYSMFSGCAGLTSAPELPATTLANYCYHSMFHSCTHLALIKVHFTAWRRTQTSNWVVNVSSAGTFYKPSALPENFGFGTIPPDWTVVNID